MYKYYLLPKVLFFSSQSLFICTHALPKCVSTSVKLIWVKLYHHLLPSLYNRQWNCTTKQGCIKTPTCSIAGVREAVGREGLQRFMGEKSEVVTSKVGGLICRTFGGLRVFPELCVLIVVLLPTEDELVSVSTKLVSTDKPMSLSTWWTRNRKWFQHVSHINVIL